MTKDNLYSLIEKVRSNNPLVHNITNYVVMNNTANALLAVGASPIMAHAIEEAEEMVTISSVLVVNIGTLEIAWVDSMEKAMAKARELGKPIVLDPVGAGASLLRNQSLVKLLNTAAPSVLRGNGSEIMAVHNHAQKTRGVDSSVSSDSALSAAKALNQSLGTVVCVSGATDYIIDEEKTVKLSNGHELMAKVTGMGCTATAVIGAFTAVHNNYFEATTAAMALMGVAGELAAQQSKGPGTLQLHLLDKFYNLTKEEFFDTLKFEMA